MEAASAVDTAAGGPVTETTSEPMQEMSQKSKIELIEGALLKNIGGGTCYYLTCYSETCYHQTCYHQTCYHQTCYLGWS